MLVVTSHFFCLWNIIFKLFNYFVRLASFSIYLFIRSIVFVCMEGGYGKGVSLVSLENPRMTCQAGSVVADCRRLMNTG